MVRSWLYCPGDAPEKIAKAGSYGSDGVIFDLEDSVAAGKKEAARAFVAEEISPSREVASRVASRVASGGAVARTGVRINAVGTRWWYDDLRAVVRAGVRIIRAPKVENRETVLELSAAIDSLESEYGIETGTVRVQCILETPAGVEAAFLIAAASPRTESLCFGAEDYCTATGIRRDAPAFALDYPRSRIVAAAAANGVDPYDSVWSAYKDDVGLRDESVRARALGFRGKSVIHPGQITIVNEVFSYSAEELSWARTIVDRVQKATGTDGVVGIDGSMVDMPVFTRAKKILGENQETNG